MPESGSYQDKKHFFSRVLTVYGRKPVLETLLDESLTCHALHLAHSNRESGIVAEIRKLAESRSVTVQHHSREQLARLSKNGKQDQGVALDVVCPAFRTLAEFLDESPPQGPRRLLALDGISNPQNLGMIIRSAAAGAIDGILLPHKGNAALGPLVIKASAGTVYRAPLLLCASLVEALGALQAQGARICTLEAEAPRSLFEAPPQGTCIYVLGNETEGVNRQVSKLADERLSIPMRNGVESLNVAVTASLIAYAPYLER